MIEEEVVRREKLEALRKAHIDPYPARARRTRTIHEARERFDALMRRGETETLAGRLRTIRAHGGLTFAHLEDGSGRMQIALRRNEVGAGEYERFVKLVDPGDFVQVTGTFFLTKNKEQTLEVKQWRILTKALLPLPEKFHGLEDTETRYRHREMDLLANESVRSVTRARSLLVQRARELLCARGYLEVETPILQPIPGGANARPFITHHNALGADLYLRVAPELYLKRLLVGGFEKVFEVARCFRNEGIDHQHNPEFTQIEGYAAYENYEDSMHLFEEMLPDLIQRLGLDVARVPYGDEHLDFTPPYPRITFFDAIKKYTQYDIRTEKNREKLVGIAQAMGGSVTSADSHYAILDEIFKKSVRAKIFQPTYIIDYPIELSPLVKVKDDNPGLVERAQLLVHGFELVQIFSELNDPLDQEKRFRDQEAARQAGDEEAQRIDQPFIDALKRGMPPAAGFGIGIDRLTMLLTNQPNIKEVILFPTLKPISPPF